MDSKQVNPIQEKIESFESISIQQENIKSKIYKNPNNFSEILQ